MSNVPLGEVPQDTTVKSEMKVKGLPAGWRREVVVRKNGQSAGKTDVYYYSPCGKKFRSKPQIARFLGDHADLTVFDFSRAGTPGDGSSRRGARDRSARRAGDAAKSAPPPIRPLSLNPLRDSGPVRRTCGVIKLPVTCFAPPSDEDVRLSTMKMEASMAPQPSPPQQQQQQQQPGSSQMAMDESLTENKPKPPAEQPKQTPASGVSSSSSSAVVLPLLWENSLKGVKAHNHETYSEINITPAEKPRNGLSRPASAGAAPPPKDPLGLPEHKPLTAGGGSLESSKPQMLGALLAAKPSSIAPNVSVKGQGSLGVSGTAAVVPSLLAHGKKGAGPIVVTSLKNVQENGSLVTVGNQNSVSSIVLTFPSVASANAFKAKQAAAGGGVITVPAASRQQVVKPISSISVAQRMDKQVGGGASISLASSRGGGGGLLGSSSSAALASGAGGVHPHYHVSESDLRMQEEKVKLLRKQLLAAQSSV